VEGDSGVPGRELRTVIRWEKELGLPVHRYPGKSKGRVYALASELKAWADEPRRAAAEALALQETAAGASDEVEAADSLERESGSEASALRTRTGDRHRRWLAAGVSISIIVVLIAAAALLIYRQQPISSVAVLPFSNLGGESDSAFVEGLTDEIASSLARLDGVRVTGRSSAYTFQGKHESLQKVGAALGVQAVVEGSVQRSGERTHVTVQVSRTADGFTIWSQTFDSSSRDLIPTETEIATAVARSLSRTAPANVAAPGTSDAEARALYLQGRYLWNQRNFEAEKKSVEYMRQAIAKDPNYAQAWSGLADSLMTIGNLEMVRPVDYIPEARDAARKALQLDPNLADAHAVLGRIAAHYDFNWPTAESEYKKALALNPNYVTAHQYYALGLMAHGHFAEAQQQLDLARQLDPLALIVEVDVALLRKFQRDYDGVILEAQHVLQLDPNYRTGYAMLGTGYYLTRRWDDWLQLDARYPLNNPVTKALAKGDLALAHHLLAELEKQAAAGAIPATLLVNEAVRAGDKKLALDGLERCYQNHDYWLLFFNIDPEMDPIRSEPQFQAMMRRIGVQ
jgi:TolB-like protein